MKSPKTIEDLLEKYKKKEHLEKTNEVYCTECGDKQCAEKNLEILEGAAILALQLKRYKEGHMKDNGAKTTAEKVEKHIAFSRELKLKRIPSWGIKDTVQHYKLRGVIEHTGKTTKDGHYLAYVREGNAWTKWDDDTSSIIPWKKVQRKQAYILIWEKTEEKPILDVNESDKEMELDMKNKKRKRAEHRNLMQEKGTRKEVGHAEKRKKIAVITRNNEEEENQMKRRQRSTENEDPATRRMEEEKMERQHIAALEEIIHKLLTEMTNLTEKVHQITKENREIKCWARVIEAKIWTLKEADEDEWLREKVVERPQSKSPTPVRERSVQVNQPPEVRYGSKHEDTKIPTEVWEKERKGEKKDNYGQTRENIRGRLIRDEIIGKESPWAQKKEEKHIRREKEYEEEFEANQTQRTS